MLEIDEKRLDSLLHERKSNIELGKKIPIDGYFAAGVFLFALLTVNYSSIPFLSKTDGWLQISFRIFFWLLFFAYVIYLVIKTVKICRSTYNTEMLKKDLLAIAKKKSKFSLIVIKDNNAPPKFLLFYDKRWKCYLFMYFHTVNNENSNIIKAKQTLCNNLGLRDSNEITARFLFEKTHEKRSVPDKINKVYEHRFYEVVVPQEMLNKKTYFRVGNRKYRWMTIDDMRIDKALMQKNEDVIEYINEYYN